MAKAETSLDVARKRLLAYLEDPTHDLGYEPEDLLLHDLWVIEEGDLPWLEKQMSRAELPVSHRQWASSLLRWPEHRKQMERAIAASEGGNEPGRM